MQKRQLIIIALLAVTFVGMVLTSGVKAQNIAIENSFTVYTEREEYEMGDIVNVLAKGSSIPLGKTITVTDVTAYDIFNQTAAEWHDLSIILNDNQTEKFVGSFAALEAGTYTVNATASDVGTFNVNAITTGSIHSSCWKFFCWSKMHNIKIIPEGSTSTGEPLITNSPANLLLYSVGHSPIKNVWLLLVINENTYDNLDTITTTLGVTVSKSDFKLVTTSWLPLFSADLSINPTYPGSCIRYQVSAIKDKIGTTGNLYFACVHLVDEITTTPTAFTLTVNMNTPTNFKVLLIALGRYNKITCTESLPFNEGSAYSNSTLVIPELETILLITAPLCALGAYTVKRKRK